MHVIEPILNKNNAENLQNAIETVRDKKATRVEVDGFLVYRCGTSIRIDIKGVLMITDNILAIIAACDETLKMMQAYHYDAQALVCPKIYCKSFSCDECPVKDDHRKLFTRAAIEQMREQYEYLRSSSYGMYVDTDIVSTKNMLMGNSPYGRMIDEPKGLAEMLINFCNYYFGSDPVYY